MGKESYYYPMNQNMREILKITNLMDMAYLKANLIIIMVVISEEKRKEKENMKI